MSDATSGEISTHNVHDFDPRSALTPFQTLKPEIAGGLKQFFVSLARSLPGAVAAETATELISGVADYEMTLPLYSAQPFRYAALPNLPAQGLERTAESTARSAISNMYYMQERFGVETFAADPENAPRRNTRLIEWVAPIDEDYQLRARGGSGAGTFSIDIGLGVLDYSKNWQPKYKELWRSGIDTSHAGDDVLGARFIRTGSGIKSEHDDFKVRAFDTFRKRHGILPQRLLGLVGLYLMRELEPDYAVALTTVGARRLSTLGRSKGCCDYSGIFANIGFEPSADEFWMEIPDFADGFYKALMKAGIRRREEGILDASLNSLNDMVPLGADQQDKGRLFELCTDDGREVIEREVEVALARHKGRIALFPSTATAS